MDFLVFRNIFKYYAATDLHPQGDPQDKVYL